MYSQLKEKIEKIKNQGCHSGPWRREAPIGDRIERQRGWENSTAYTF